ncbi:MAG: VOC family protein [Acidimicrobiales bacterium]|jgi:catechol 2,3-dioxygenase-like lactoylglutathione lyase family enzyme
MEDERRQALVKGVHHVGLTVSDLERSFAFYERLLGRVRDFSTESEGPVLSKAVGVPGAHLRFGFITLGSVHLELLEYRNPRRERYELSNADPGAPHVCFEVTDLKEAMASLAADGIRFYSDPLDIDEGPLAGYSFVYFDDPDGITLELFAHRGGG